MKKLTISTAIIAALLSLSACGGGGDGDGDSAGSPGTPPGDTGGGDTGDRFSEEPEDLVRFVKDEGRVGDHHEGVQGTGVERISAFQFLENDGSVTVTADRFADGSYGVIQIAKSGEPTVYMLDEGLVATTAFPDGTYSGPIDVDYTVDGGETWRVGHGKASILIDAVSGEAAFGGTAIAYDLDNNTLSSVEYTSTANLAGGAFVDNEAEVTYREGDSLIETDSVIKGTFKGSVEGMMVGSGNGSGATGFVGGDDGLFKADGGFTAAHDSATP